MTQEKKVSKKGLFKCWWYGCHEFIKAHNYQRFYGLGWTQGMIPALQELYDKEELTEAMQFWTDKFYISETTTGMVLNAIVIRMEERRANGADIPREAMQATRDGLMGALAGFGDTIFTSTLRPLAMAIFTPMAISGNVMGPIGFMLFKAAARYINSVFWWKRGLKLGSAALDKMLDGGNSKLRVYMEGASTMSMIVMGAMTAKYVTAGFNLQITTGETVTSLQNFLDTALPGIVPLGAVFLTYWLMSKKKVNTTWIILGFAVFCILGALVGLF